MQNDLIKAGKEALKFNKHLTEVHVTSDGTAFVEKDLARYHAKDLGDKEVLCVKRSEKDETEPPAGNIDEASKDLVAKKEAAAKKKTEKEAAAKKKAEKEAADKAKAKDKPATGTVHVSPKKDVTNNPVSPDENSGQA